MRRQGADVRAGCSPRPLNLARNRFVPALKPSSPMPELMAKVAFERKALVTLSVGIENLEQSKKLVRQFGTVLFACTCTLVLPVPTSAILILC